MLGYIAKVKDTGRHNVGAFPYALALDNGCSVDRKTGEVRHRALFIDNYAEPTRFWFSTLYDPEEIENWVGRVSLDGLAGLVLAAQQVKGEKTNVLCEL